LAGGEILVKKNAGIFGALAVVLAILGMSSLPRNSGGGGSQSTPESAKGSKEPAKKAKAGNKSIWSACDEIQNRLQPLVSDSPEPTWTPPKSCYIESKSASDHKLNVENVDFVIATAPNPISTHLPLSFDRILEIIQQAAQDNGYLYESSWLPWNEPKEYSRLEDQLLSDDSQDFQEKQPGVLVFRNPPSKILAPTADISAQMTGEGGLAVFVVSELPTGGINQVEFYNALAWIQQLGGLSPEKGLRILGPNFSGSLPSLYKALFHIPKLDSYSGKPGINIFSGGISSESLYQWFNERLGTGTKKFGLFRTAMEGDSHQLNRFCNYIQYQGYDTNRVAILSEDETPFGGAVEERRSEENKHFGSMCSGASTYLYYPRDIATLRSAYEQQSIFNSAKQVSNTNVVSTTLRGDLSEPANSEHDTVRSYGGQLTPLAQESVLLAITDVLKAKKIQFVVVRSTNSLDEIFLGQFLRRAIPETRIVMDGADLLFRRGAEGSSLRGVMLLSTYPLLTWQQDWSSSNSQSSPADGESYRIFGQDIAEGVYIAARELFPYQISDDVAKVSVANYAPPAWARKPNGGAPDSRPATWLTVIGHRQFWPVAVLNSNTVRNCNTLLNSDTLTDGPRDSILWTSSDLNDSRMPKAGGDPHPLHLLPVEFWVLLIICVVWSALHLLWCWCGSISPAPAAFRLAYFAPVPLREHSALIGIGSVLVAAAAMIVAVFSGLVKGELGVWNGVVAAVLVFVFLCAGLGCARNYLLPPMTDDDFTVRRSTMCRLIVAGGSVLFLAAFMQIQKGFINKLLIANSIPAFWRSVHLLSGVSALVPQLFLIAGLYCWFWFCLRGLSLFGSDRPLLPKGEDLILRDGTPMPMFSREEAETPIELAARPLGKFYLIPLLIITPVVVLVCGVVLDGWGLRTLGEKRFGVFMFLWLALCIALILADTAQSWFVWRRLQVLLDYLDRLPLRRTLNALQGLSWRSVWAMSGNVLAERYRLISRQIEALRHLENQMKGWVPDNLEDAQIRDKLELRITAFQGAQMKDFVDWYMKLGDDPVETVEPLREVQEEMASIAGFVLVNILIPSWHNETDSLIFDPLRTRNKEEETDKGPRIASDIPHHVLAAEEFFVLPYLGFIQNILGRIRTIVLGILCLFIATTLAVSSYPFDPLPVLGGIFLALFVITGTTIVVIYAGMHRDATLSYITDTSPGELGGEFWRQVFTFGVGPLLGLLTTLFPSITDFVVSWLQPSTQAIK
jgi:hypothetical protein